MEKPPNPPQPPAARPSRAAAAAGFLRRTLALGLLACVVASLGLTAGTQVEPERPKSFSEQALNEAFATSRVLAAEAESLAASLRGASAAAVQETADTLNQQALLLTSPGGAAALQKAEGINGRSLPQALADSARKNLAAAGRADHGTARLLASTGTGQLLLALRTAPALGESPGPVPESGWTPVLDDAVPGKCSGSGQSVPGPDAAASLQAVLDAEFGAVYAYEVSQAQGGSSFAVLGQTAAEQRAAHLPEVADALLDGLARHAVVMTVDEGKELVVDLLVIINGVASVHCGNINNVENKSAAFNVAEEIVSETDSFGSAFDKTGNIRHYKRAALAHSNYSQNRGKGCKVVVRNLRLCFTYNRHKC